jgi:subtilisin family serine protease
MATPAAKVRPSRYVIGLSDNAIPAGLSRDIENAGGRLVRRLPAVGLAIAVSAEANFPSLLSERSSVEIAFVGRVPVAKLAATVTGKQVYGPTTADEFYRSGQLWGVSRVRAESAWDSGFAGSHRTVVAVIDTGIAWNHPDLSPNVVFAACDTAAPSCLAYPSLSGHGTHVAGTIAAAFGGGGAVGVGPRLGLASYNIFEEIPDCGVCSYTDSRWATMIDAAARGFSVINLSLGHTVVLGGKGSTAVSAAIAAERRVAAYVNRAGTLIVAAAGNSSFNLAGPIVHVPGDIQGIVNVGATGIRPLPRYPQSDAYDVLGFYSNYGAPVTLSAPGGDTGPDDCCGDNQVDPTEYLILSTAVYPGHPCSADASCPVGYEWKAGTSMAAAHVAGVVGLMRDANPTLSPRQVTAILKRTAMRVGARQQFGHGIIDASESVRAAVRE